MYRKTVLVAIFTLSMISPVIAQNSTDNADDFERTVSLESGVEERIAFEGSKSLREIQILAKEQAEVTVEVKELEVSEMDRVADAGKIYSAVNITVRGIDPTDINAGIAFSTPKSWIGRPSEVRIYRYAGGWNRLPTQIRSSSGSDYVFQSPTPAFSIFVVAKPGAVSPNTGDVSASEQSTERGIGFRLLISAFVTGTLLLVVKAGFMFSERRKKQQMREDFSETIQAVQQAIQSNQGMPEARIKELIDEAQKAMTAEDYERLDEIMDELVNIIRENSGS